MRHGCQAFGDQDGLFGGHLADQQRAEFLQVSETGACRPKPKA